MCISTEPEPARFGAQWRQYKYWFVQDSSLDLAAMRQAVASLLGDHDFRNFCKVQQICLACCTALCCSSRALIRCPGGLVAPDNKLQAHHLRGLHRPCAGHRAGQPAGAAPQRHRLSVAPGEACSAAELCSQAGPSHTHCCFRCGVSRLCCSWWAGDRSSPASWQGCWTSTARLRSLSTRSRAR